MLILLVSCTVCHLFHGFFIWQIVLKANLQEDLCQTKVHEVVVDKMRVANKLGINSIGETLLFCRLPICVLFTYQHLPTHCFTYSSVYVGLF